MAWGFTRPNLLRSPLMDAPTEPSAPKRANPHRRMLLGLGLLAGVLRLLHVWAMRESPYFDAPAMDSAYHVDWARALLAGESFQDGPFFRAPLYVWFLAGIQSLFGPGLLAPRLVQSVLGVATTLLTTKLALRFFRPRAAALAGLLAATSWVLIHFDAQLLIPTLAIPLNLGAIILTLRAGDDQESHYRRWAITAGLAWGLSAIARPNVLLLIPLGAIWLARICPGVTGAKRVAGKGRRLALLLCLGAAVPIVPLSLYNRIVGGDTVLIASQAGVNLWIGNNPHSDGSTAIVPGTRGGWWEGFHDSIAAAELAEGRSLKPSEVSSHYTSRALRWALDQPGDALSHLVWKLRLFFASAELGNNLDVSFFAKHFNPLLAWSPARWEWLMGLALLGGLVSWNRRRELVPLWGFAIVYTASVVLFFVCSRYRTPILPVLFIFSGCGLDWLFERIRTQPSRAAAGFTLVLAVALGSRVPPAGIRPSVAVGTMQLAQAEAAAGNHEKARTLFEQALAVGGANPQVINGLALSCHSLGQGARALRLVEDGLRQTQGRDVLGSNELTGLLVLLLVDQGQVPLALTRAEGFLTRHPDSVPVLFGRAQARMASGDFEGARWDLLRVLELAPDMTQAGDLLKRITARN